ncbi:MAG TPA: hypothetical protein VND64_23965 [Pirellulales bacterium]|nr:hypothetical protein [Pirellulales bacterium]
MGTRTRQAGKSNQRQEILHHPSMYVGQQEVAAGITEREPLVVERIDLRCAAVDEDVDDV